MANLKAAFLFLVELAVGLVNSGIPPSRDQIIDYRVSSTPQGSKYRTRLTHRAAINGQTALYGAFVTKQGVTVARWKPRRSRRVSPPLRASS